MSSSVTLGAILRQQLGSRPARKLRAEGRIPASLQSSDGKPNVDLHVGEEEFRASRRHHVHLYDLDIEGGLESAVVREVQFDALGDRIMHVEFKRVVRGVETEAEVRLEFVGQPKEGIFNHLLDTLEVRTIPSNIPDAIEVKVEHLAIGQHLKASDIGLPEGVSLVTPPDTDVAVCSAPRAAAAEVEEEETEEGGEAEG